MGIGNTGHLKGIESRAKKRATFRKAMRLEEENKILTKQRDALLVALKKYGKHTSCCNINLNVLRSTCNDKCTCGFEQTIAEAEAAK